MSSEPRTFADLKPTRADVERMCSMQQPTTLTNCDLDGLDLSDLNFTGWCFDHCDLKRTSLNGAQLEDTRFKSCRAF
jgi:fluoroquinolone resistance protein